MNATNAGRGCACVQTCKRPLNASLCGFNQSIQRLRCPCSHSPYCTAAFGCLMRINEMMRRFKLAGSWRVVRTFEDLCTKEVVCHSLCRRGRRAVRFTVPHAPPVCPAWACVSPATSADAATWTPECILARAVVDRLPAPKVPRCATLKLRLGIVVGVDDALPGEQIPRPRGTQAAAGLSARCLRWLLHRLGEGSKRSRGDRQRGSMSDALLLQSLQTRIRHAGGRCPRRARSGAAD